ncbi:MAG: SGNH/GDSL hydrolase family protein [Sphingobacteriaceae bacterium]|nr:SGNH/GDSL hydrolase family protein [Sphingobacteriaceae bacterium]
MRFNLFLLTLCLLLICDKNMSQSMNSNTPLTYLALGDSYTIGEAVEQKLSFPYQLVSELATQNVFVTTPKIIAKTGWTTDELQSAIKVENVTQKFDIVTLLIGVNNQYRGNSRITYRKEFAALLQTAISYANGNKKHVFVVSIPDWGITPFGKSSGKDIAKISAEIDAFNAIAKEETLAMNVSYTDITLGSRYAGTDLSLVATDGLHPSGKMYAEWAVKVSNAVVAAFK